MKFLLVFINLWFLTHCLVLAQKSTTIRVKDGQIANKVVPFNERYQYPQFRPGSLTYISGNVSTAKFNYNVLLGEMQIIAPTGDTLSLANEQAIKQVVIGEDVFYYDVKYGYLQVEADYSSLKLAGNQRYKVVGLDKTGAYDQSTSTSSIKNINVLSGSNSQVYKLQAKGDIVLSKSVTYYIVDHNGYFHPATRNSLLKLYTGHRKTINNYVSQQDINFTKEEDLKKVLEFCSGLK